MDYEVKHPFLGKKFVAFNCEKCGDELQCPIEDAGTQQECPRCAAPFITPGQKELEEDRHRTHDEQEKKKREEHEQRLSQFRQQEEQNRRQQQLAVASAPPPPEMVWYGEMHCDSCGYSWQARRNTPPARCPSCSKRDVVPVRRPKRTAGCAAVLFLFIILLASAVISLQSLHSH